MEAREVRSFPGFEEADFRVFDIPGFVARMAAIRGRIAPKLMLLGEPVAEGLMKATRELFVAHVARHARRTVNPPPETWVAFSRDPRKYKPLAHLALVVSGRGVDARLVLKEESLDKPNLAGALVRERKAIEEFLDEMPGLGWYLPVPGGGRREPGDPPTPVEALPGRFWDDLAEALGTKRTSAVEIGFPLPKESRKLGPTEFQRFAVRALLTLFPLYWLATRPGARMREAPGVAAR